MLLLLLFFFFDDDVFVLVFVVGCAAVVVFLLAASSVGRLRVPGTSMEKIIMSTVTNFDRDLVVFEFDIKG